MKELVDKEELEYLKNTVLKYEALRSKCIRTQHKVNDSKEVKLYSDMTREELEEQLADAKMAVFEVWHLAALEKEYQI